MITTPLILAIDPGKFNGVFCLFDPATRRIPLHSTTNAMIRTDGFVRPVQARRYSWEWHAGYVQS